MQRVAAYCRVSTESSDQINSLNSQTKYFTDYINRNPLWSLYDVYVDEGITGTSTKNRYSFNRMIADAQNKNFDLIITKEISRFARNTLDSIFFTRKLKDLGIGVIFINDNINTLEPDAELRLTIMSSIAQEESRKTSDRVKWGQKRRMEQGVVFGRDMLGYNVCDGKLYINEDGAEIVKLIFHKYVNEGKGTHVIARELKEAEIPTATYMKNWSNTVILRILRNEKYCGDLIQKKTYTPSYLNHEKKYNRGEEEFVELHNHHEPIISRELFNKAQLELNRRSPSDDMKAKHSNRYCFSGKIKCGICGSSYVSRTRARKDGSVNKSWRCYESAKNGNYHIDNSGNETGCNNRTLNDDILKLVMQQIIKYIEIDKERITDNLMTLVESVLNKDINDNKHNIEKINKLIKKKQSLIELYLNQDIEKNEYIKLKNKYESEIAAIEKEYNNFIDNKQVQNENNQHMQNIISTIKGLLSGEIWDDCFYRQILQRIVVKENNILDIYLQNLPEYSSYIICDSKQLIKKWNDCPDLLFKEQFLRHFDASQGTEELGHLEMIGAIVYQLTRNLSEKDIKTAGFDAYFVDHTAGIFPTSASGTPYTASAMQSKGDVLADLHEDLAAEQKARTTYDNILRFCSDNPDVRDAIKFLRQREVVHYQRFGEGLRIATDRLNSKNFYAFNPSFDMPK